jgi:hypothetical protein
MNSLDQYTEDRATGATASRAKESPAVSGGASWSLRLAGRPGPSDWRPLRWSLAQPDGDDEGPHRVDEAGHVHLAGLCRTGASTSIPKMLSDRMFVSAMVARPALRGSEGCAGLAGVEPFT